LSGTAVDEAVEAGLAAGEPFAGSIVGFEAFGDVLALLADRFDEQEPSRLALLDAGPDESPDSQVCALAVF